MATTTTSGGKKGGKKKKGQTLSLNTFLADSGYQAPPKKLNWAEESDDTQGGTIELAEEYGGPPMDLRNLPSGPRASRAVDLDMSRLPTKPPYTAFLGNLPFDVTEEEIRNLFHGLNVDNIRFPQESGRVKGFGYAEFYDIEELKQALSLSNEKIRSRQIRIDIADQAGKDQGGRDGGRGGGGGGFDDKTSSDWRNDDGLQERDGRRDRRDDRRNDGDRERRPAGPADTDDCWRKDDDSSNRRDDYMGGRNDRGGNYRDDRGGGYDRGGYRDDRGGGYRDDRGGGYRDDRGSGYRDDRGSGYRDNRSGGYRDDRGGGYRDNRGGGYRDNRGGGYRDNRDGGFRDDRGGGFRDDRGGGFRDDRGGGFRDDRGGGFRDDRSGGFRDDRGGGLRDHRGDGGGYRGGGDRDDRDSTNRSDAPASRPKLNLKPRTVEADANDVEKAPSPAKSSIFGNAKPVDTAIKERQIEEKLNSLNINDVKRSDERDLRGRRDDRQRDGRDQGRGRSRDDARQDSYRDIRREQSRDSEFDRDLPEPRGQEPPPNSEIIQDEQENVNNGHSVPISDEGEARFEHENDQVLGNGNPQHSKDEEPLNWRDEMKPNEPIVVKKVEENKDNTVHENSKKSYGDGGKQKENLRSPKGKKWNDTPIVPPKYEEPPQPVFSQASRYAALGFDEEGGAGVSDSDDREDIASLDGDTTRLETIS